MRTVAAEDLECVSRKRLRKALKALQEARMREADVRREVLGAAVASRPAGRLRFVRGMEPVSRSHEYRDRATGFLSRLTLTIEESHRGMLIQTTHPTDQGYWSRAGQRRGDFGFGLRISAGRFGAGGPEPDRGERSLRLCWRCPRQQ